MYARVTISSIFKKNFHHIAWYIFGGTIKNYHWNLDLYYGNKFIKRIHSLCNYPKRTRFLLLLLVHFTPLVSLDPCPYIYFSWTRWASIYPSENSRRLSSLDVQLLSNEYTVSLSCTVNVSWNYALSFVVLWEFSTSVCRYIHFCIYREMFGILETRGRQKVFLRCIWLVTINGNSCIKKICIVACPVFPDEKLVVVQIPGLYSTCDIIIPT